MREDASPPEDRVEFPPEGPARESRAADLPNEGWASVIGTVISRNPSGSSFVLDDGSGQVTVSISALPEPGSTVRVLGRIIPGAEGKHLDAAIVQDFQDFEVDLYRKVVELEERVFSQDADYRQ